VAAVGAWLVRGGHDRRATQRRAVDVLGQLLAVVSLATLTASLIEANSLGWTAPLIVAGLAVFVVTLAGFIVVESRSPAPMLPLGLFRNRAFRSATLASSLACIAFYGLIFVLSLFFQDTWRLSAAAAGLGFLPMSGSTGLLNIGVGSTIARWGVRVPVIAGTVATIAGLAALLGTIENHSYVVALLPLLVVGAGIGLMFPALTVAMLGRTDTASAGIASGAFNTLRQVGGIIGVAVMGLLVGHGASLQAVQACIVAAMVALGIGLVISLTGVGKP
jgi:MFS transporter, DHA2 family, methylenomycin A resistance protein